MRSYCTCIPEGHNLFSSLSITLRYGASNSANSSFCVLRNASCKPLVALFPLLASVSRICRFFFSFSCSCCKIKFKKINKESALLKCLKYNSSFLRSNQSPQDVPPLNFFNYFLGEGGVLLIFYPIVDKEKIYLLYEFG